VSAERDDGFGMRIWRCVRDGSLYAVSQPFYYGFWVGRLLEKGEHNKPQDADFGLVIIQRPLHSLRIKFHQDASFSWLTL
jgi:hypothetical protein